MVARFLGLPEQRPEAPVSPPNRVCQFFTSPFVLGDFDIHYLEQVLPVFRTRKCPMVDLRCYMTVHFFFWRNSSTLARWQLFLPSSREMPVWTWINLTRKSNFLFRITPIGVLKRWNRFVHAEADKRLHQYIVSRYTVPIESPVPLGLSSTVNGASPLCSI